MLGLLPIVSLDKPPGRYFLHKVQGYSASTVYASTKSGMSVTAGEQLITVHDAKGQSAAIATPYTPNDIFAVRTAISPDDQYFAVGFSEHYLCL